MAKCSINEQPAWCYVYNVPAIMKNTVNYNWYAVTDSRGLAPEGWHVSTYEEWYILTDYLGGDEKAGYKMKSNNEWFTDVISTNSSGFSAPPGDERKCHSGNFTWIGKFCRWWSSTEGSSSGPIDCKGNNWVFLLEYSNRMVGGDYKISAGYSVRCLRD